MRRTFSVSRMGFRPGRRPHDALDALSVALERKKVNWVLDADIRDFFTQLDQGWLERFLEHRIADKRVLRLIQKWLRAGVIEDGEWSQTEAGTAQGASVSPLLSNVFLHYVFDLWPTSGDAAGRAGTFFSCGSPTTSWRAFSIVR